MKKKKDHTKILVTLDFEANEEIRRFRIICDYIKGYKDVKSFYVTEMVKLFDKLTDKEIEDLIKK